MNDREAIEQVRSRPGLYGLDGSYENVHMFLVGFDVARSGGLMRGFTEWMVVRRGECTSFGWQALVLDEAFPDLQPMGWNKLGQLTPEQQQEAVDLLLSLLLEFLAMRDDGHGPKLAHMYAKYYAMYAAMPERGSEH